MFLIQQRPLMKAEALSQWPHTGRTTDPLKEKENWRDSSSCYSITPPTLTSDPPQASVHSVRR